MARKAAAKAVTPEVVDVQPENPELTLARQEGNSLAAFVGGIVQFFAQAQDLEKRARQELDLARTWTVPTSKEEDERLCGLIRQNTIEKKDIEARWEITTIVHRFHKRLTAHRNRAVELREEVSTIGNRLHNRYAEEEKRRAREEEERQRREAEERARLDRERELAELERKALEAESASPELSEREQTFVDFYLRGSAPHAAAKLAGYRNPDAQALKLLDTPKIKAAIEAARQAIEIRRQATARKAAPIVVEDTVDVKPQVDEGDRSTWSATVFDEEAFIVALLDPMTRTRCGAGDLAVDTLKWALATSKGSLPPLNKLAVAIHEQVDRIPGVRHKKTTRVV